MATGKNERRDPGRRHVEREARYSPEEARPRALPEIEEVFQVSENTANEKTEGNEEREIVGRHRPVGFSYGREFAAFLEDRDR